MKLQRKALAVGIISALCLCLTAQKVTATESINSVSVKVSLNIEAGDRLPDIKINQTDGECYVTSGDKKIHNQGSRMGHFNFKGYDNRRRT
jgi:hypothetical protein